MLPWTTLNPGQSQFRLIFLHKNLANWYDSEASTSYMMKGKHWNEGIKSCMLKIAQGFSSKAPLPVNTLTYQRVEDRLACLVSLKSKLGKSRMERKRRTCYARTHIHTHTHTHTHAHTAALWHNGPLTAVPSLIPPQRAYCNLTWARGRERAVSWDAQGYLPVIYDCRSMADPSPDTTPIILK